MIFELQESIDSDKTWKSLGRPRSGPEYERRKKSHYIYKSQLRKKKASSEKEYNDAMFCDLANKDGVAFWKSWNRLNKSGDPLIARVNGETDPKRIAETFADYFESVYGNNDTPEHRNLKNDFHKNYSHYFSEHIDDNISPFLLTWDDMLEIVSKVKLGKSSSGRCKPEHLFHGSPDLMCHIHILFNGLLQHGYVPIEFLRGTITPVVKDTQGDLSDPANYRAITLSCLMAKMFELAIQLKTFTWY